MLHFFFNINISKNCLWIYYQSVKHFGSRLGPTFCQAWSCPNCLQRLATDDTSKQRVKLDQWVDIWKKKGSIRWVREVRWWGGGRMVRTPPPPHPLENHKSIGFLSNTGPDPLKITNLTNKHSMLEHYRPSSETPFKWRFACGPMVARL